MHRVSEVDPTDRLVVIEDRRAERPARHRPARRSRAPLLLVAVAVVFNLWVLRAEAAPVRPLNDSAIHASMVRWAESRIESGHVPMDGWYPYLSLGASRFHHYQSLPHILTAYVTVVLGDGTFRWSLYLLLALWPIAVYAGARLFELDPWVAAVAALVSPLLSSAPGLGYEDGSYTWRGSGTWTQLWGMWMLPFAWSLSWRAVAQRRSMALAALVVGVTVMVHLLTGYLALLSIGVWVLIQPREFVPRLWRAALVGLGALAAASWLLVPLVGDAGWTIQDEFSRGTYFYDSFGARRVLGWLTTGRIFDEGRLPVVSLVVAVGVIVAAHRFRRDEPSRAILGVGLLSLLLFFGRPTLGPALGVLPGGSDLFLRRYVFGVHLAGVLLAGIGGVWVSRFVVGRVRLWRPSIVPAAVGAAVAIAGIAYLTPAWLDRHAFNAQGAAWIHRQEVADRTSGAAFDALVAEAHAIGGGRLFAGKRPGSNTRIGSVPGYVALLNDDADAVGFTRPTWSIVSGVEARFDPTDPADYDLFGIGFVIAPSSRPPLPRATLLARNEPFALWRVNTTGYLNVVDTIAPVSADRTDLARQMSSVLTSGLPGDGMLPTIAFGGRPAAPPTLGRDRLPAKPAGSVIREFDGPVDGVFAGRVKANRPSVVLLKASFDPRWVAAVDGERTQTQMIAPGLVGVVVGPGRHDVLFSYLPYPWYASLLLLSAFSLVALAVGERRGIASGRHRRRHLRRTA